jgi:hypothetical protein
MTLTRHNWHGEVHETDNNNDDDKTIMKMVMITKTITMQDLD